MFHFLWLGMLKLVWQDDKKTLRKVNVVEVTQ